MIKETRVAAIYCRVSKDEQHPKNQEHYLKKYCSINNIQVYKVYTDVITGKTSTRPELDIMLQDMRKKLFNSIVSYKVDRLGRSVKHLETISEECFNKNISLIFATQLIDTATPAGKMFFTILGAIAEFETSLISERTKLGQKKNRHLVGKRGPDKNPHGRRKSGYYLRWQKEKNKKMGGE
jgi:DNA invertase Pin-like site-specific DNA recombinase